MSIFNKYITTNDLLDVGINYQEIKNPKLQNDINALINMSSARINNLTGGYVEKVGFDNLNDAQKLAVQKSTLWLCADWYAAGLSFTRINGSFTTGGGGYQQSNPSEPDYIRSDIVDELSNVNLFDVADTFASPSPPYSEPNLNNLSIPPNIKQYIDDNFINKNKFTSSNQTLLLELGYNGGATLDLQLNQQSAYENRLFNRGDSNNNRYLETPGHYINFLTGQSLITLGDENDGSIANYSSKNLILSNVDNDKESVEFSPTFLTYKAANDQPKSISWPNLANQNASGNLSEFRSYSNLQRNTAYLVANIDLSVLKDCLFYTSARRDVFSFQGQLSFAYTNLGFGNALTIQTSDFSNSQKPDENITTTDAIGIFYVDNLNNNNFNLWYQTADQENPREVIFALMTKQISDFFVNAAVPGTLPSSARPINKQPSDMFEEENVPETEKSIYVNPNSNNDKLVISADKYNIVNNVLLNGTGIAIDRDPITQKITIRSTNNIANVKRQYNASDFNTPQDLINGVQIGDSIRGDGSSLNWFTTTIPLLEVFDKATDGSSITLWGYSGATADRTMIILKNTDTWPISISFGNNKIGASSFKSEFMLQTNDLDIYKIVSDNSKTVDSIDYNNEPNYIDNLYILGNKINTTPTNYDLDQRTLTTNKNLLEHGIFELQIPPGNYGILYDIQETTLGVLMIQGFDLSVYRSPDSFTDNRRFTVYPSIDGNDFPNNPTNSSIAFVFDKYTNFTNNDNNNGWEWLTSLDLVFHVATYEDDDGKNHWTFGVRNTNATENRTVYIHKNGYLQYNYDRGMSFLPYKVIDQNDIAWYDFGNYYYKNTWVDRTSDLDDTNDWIVNEGFTLSRVRITTANRTVSAYCTSGESNVYFYIQNNASEPYTVWNRFVDGTNLVHFDGSNTSTEGITKLEVFY